MDKSDGQDSTPRTSLPRIVLLLPLLYVFSVGPAAKIFPDPPRGVQFLYLPLKKLMENSTHGRDFLVWYGHLWGAEM